MPVYPEPPHSQELPTHYTVCSASTGAAWLTICDKLPKEDFDGLCNLWFLHACIERGRLFAVGFALPKWIYIYAKGSGVHMVLTRLATQVSVTGEMYLF